MTRKIVLGIGLLLAATTQAHAIMMPEMDPGMSVAPCTLGILTLFMVSDRFRRKRL